MERKVGKPSGGRELAAGPGGVWEEPLTAEPLPRELAWEDSGTEDGFAEDWPEPGQRALTGPC